MFAKVTRQSSNQLVFSFIPPQSLNDSLENPCGAEFQLTSLSCGRFGPIQRSMSPTLFLNVHPDRWDRKFQRTSLKNRRVRKNKDVGSNGSE